MQETRRHRRLSLTPNETTKTARIEKRGNEPVRHTDEINPPVGRELLPRNSGLLGCRGYRGQLVSEGGGVGLEALNL